jgi:hypothetical protein
VVPNVAEGDTQSGRSVSDSAVIRAVMTIVGDTDEEGTTSGSGAGEHELYVTYRVSADAMPVCPTRNRLASTAPEAKARTRDALDVRTTDRFSRS